MTTLSVTDASRRAGVSRQAIYEQIRRGQIRRSSAGIAVNELIRVYPHLGQGKSFASMSPTAPASTVPDQPTEPTNTTSDATANATVGQTIQQAGTVELLVRELEWNKELLEQTNQLMAKQLADQRSLIADQARRLDEKDRFWARQIEIAQSLLPAPAPVARKKFLGIF